MNLPKGKRRPTTKNDREKRPSASSTKKTKTAIETDREGEGSQAYWARLLVTENRAESTRGSKEQKSTEKSRRKKRGEERTEKIFISWGSLVGISSRGSQSAMVAPALLHWFQKRNRRNWKNRREGMGGRDK